MRGKRGYIIGTSIIILLFGLYVIKNFAYRYSHSTLEWADDISGLKKMPTDSEPILKPSQRTFPTDTIFTQKNNSTHTDSLPYESKNN